MNNLFMGQVFALRFDVRSNRVKYGQKNHCTVLLKQIFKHLVLTQVIIFHGLQSLNCPTNEICHTYLRVCRAGLFLTDHLFSPVIDIAESL